MKTLSNENITDSVRRTSISWVLAMQKEYGHEVGLKCFDVMRQTFGEDLVGAVMFGILSGQQHRDVITFRWNKDPNRRLIEAIKEVRYLSGMGLKEAKDCVETSIIKDASFAVKPEMLLPENATHLNHSLRTLENCGFMVL